MTEKGGASYLYDHDPAGRLTGVRASNGYQTHYAYDLSDRILREYDNTGRENTYTYDILGNLLSTEDSEGGVSTYAYDLRGNRISEVTPMGAKRTYTYDLNGNMLTSAVSFAQSWSLMTGGTVMAFNGKTDYSGIYSGLDTNLLIKINRRLGHLDNRGASDYPTPGHQNDGVKDTEIIIFQDGEVVR